MIKVHHKRIPSKELKEICMDIYREMYRKANPKASFDKLIQKGVNNTPNWFLKYYLDPVIQQNIIDKHCKRNRLDTRQAYIINREIHIGCAPSANPATTYEKWVPK